MLRQSLYVIFALVGLGSLSGCASTGYDGKSPLDPEKGAVVGAIGEGFLTRPHGLEVYIEQVGQSSTRLRLKTKGADIDFSNKNNIGHYFLAELPPGKYQIKKWDYYHYRGSSLPRREPLTFEVSPGEVYYIGNFHATALVYCLTNTDRSDEDIAHLKAKYPALAAHDVVDVTDRTAFKDWPTTDAEDSGNGYCQL